MSATLGKVRQIQSKLKSLWDIDVCVIEFWHAGWGLSVLAFVTNMKDTFQICEPVIVGGTQQEWNLLSLHILRSRDEL